MNGKKVATSSGKETQQFGEEFAHTLKPGDTVLLYGDLGFGKTTFVQGVAKGLGVEKRIISPTFVIVRHYKIATSHQPLAIRSFYHIDLYRVETESDLKGIGMEEILRDKTSIKLIEWPEKLGSLMPNKRLEVRLNYINETEREITIKQYD